MKRLVLLALGYVGLAVLANWLAFRYVWPVFDEAAFRAKLAERGWDDNCT